MSHEVWVSVPGFDGRYDVSDRGRVRSLYMGKKRLEQPRIKKGQISKSGYERVVLSDRGKVKGWGVHRLVLTAFTRPQPQSIDCRHLDGNRRQNTLANLAWGTRSENVADTRRHGTIAMGSSNGATTLTEYDVICIKTELKNNELTQSALAERYGVCQQTISNISRRRTWSHVPPATEP